MSKTIKKSKGKSKVSPLRGKRLVRWTDAELARLHELVKQLGNKQSAFKAFAKESDRRPATVQAKYYQEMRKAAKAMGRSKLVVAQPKPSAHRVDVDSLSMHELVLLAQDVKRVLTQRQDELVAAMEMFTD